MMAETLASISEYGEDSRATSITGLSSSSYTITRSQSSDSLNTMSTITGRNYNNGLHHRERKKSEISHRLRNKSLSPKRNYEFCKKVRVTMALIGILLLVAAIFMLSFYLPKQYKTNIDSEAVIQPKNKRLIWDDNIEIKEDMLILFSTNFSSPILESEVGPDIALKAYFGELLTYNISKKQVSKVITNDSITMTFKGVNLDTKLEISKLAFHDQCYQVHWVAKYDTKLQDCFDTEASKWFGIGEIFNQVWPINKASFKMTPFLTADFLVKTGNPLGGVLEPFIINSKGAGIYVADTVPLHIGMNENDKRKFCIRAEKRRCDVEFENPTNELNYTICVADNIKEVRDIMFDQYIEKPTGIPDERMFTEPIWSTWVKFKKNVNQSVILKFAENIKKHKFQASHIVIDDKYSKEYGDFNFDDKKFEDVSNMINLLRSHGFRTIVWIPPFANLESKLFRKGLPYWVKVGSQLNQVPGIVQWWNGLGGVIDTTNEASNKWFSDRLKEFKKLKIDGFKFDAGEALSLPMYYKFTTAQPNQNYFSKYYVKLASEFTLSEVRVGYKSQKYPIFVRLMDRRSGWDSQNGLRSVLSAALSLSIIGYPFVLPDMVGGNAYIKSPSKELFIRWTQLCIFLPAIQFSIPPWYYNGEQVITIVREAMNIRQNISHYILKLAKDVVKTGEPIIRPLWWYWPNDKETFVLDSEFMLGEEYLIAPVLNPNIVRHTIYLPAGIWQELWGKREILNMTAGDYKQYTVTLHVVCYFKLIKILPG